MRKRNRRGFTLVEIVIVVGILGIIAAMAVYGLNRNKGQRDSESALRDITSFIRNARSIARSRVDIGNYGGVAGDARVEQTTITALSANQLAVTAEFSNNTVQQIELLDLNLKYPDQNLAIEAPGALNITFRSDGSRTSGSSEELTLLNPSGMNTTLEISLAGKAVVRR